VLKVEERANTRANTRARERGKEGEIGRTSLDKIKRLFNEQEDRLYTTKTGTARLPRSSWYVV
jgi:hypothetical protein